MAEISSARELICSGERDENVYVFLKGLAHLIFQNGTLQEKSSDKPISLAVNNKDSVALI